LKATLQTLDAPAPLAKTPVAEKSRAAVLGELFKMRLTTLVLLTTLVGFTSVRAAPVSWVLMFNTLFGTALLARARRPSTNGSNASTTPKCAAPRTAPCPPAG
jgi:heme O synthase-like polyprenyltransferase